LFLTGILAFGRAFGYVFRVLSSGGLRVGGSEARLERGLSDDVIIFSQP